MSELLPVRIALYAARRAVNDAIRIVDKRIALEGPPPALEAVAGLRVVDKMTGAQLVVVNRRGPSILVEFPASGSRVFFAPADLLEDVGDTMIPPRSII